MFSGILKKLKWTHSIILFAVLTFSCINKKKSSLTIYKILNDYPSASGVEYVNNQLFIIGDDANYILVLDTNFKIKDSISLYTFPGKRIPKNIKPDLEAMAALRGSTGPLMFLFGSGSLSPYRNSGWMYHLQTKTKDSLSLEYFYDQIKQKGISEINIEGACFIPGFLLLANRGNKSNPHNHLVFTEEKFWDKKNDYDIKTLQIGQQNDSSSFSGVSGLVYAPQNDWLILTVSTEDTRSSFEDGAIGKSYLWIVKKISTKKNERLIQPDRIIDLENVSSHIKGQKIESVCVLAEFKSFIQLVLVADNDNGSSTIFKMNLAKS